MSPQEQADLLNAIVETLHSISSDLHLIRQAQIEHGKALEELALKVDRHIWDDRRAHLVPVTLACEGK
jgi:lactam utilization protein B